MSESSPISLDLHSPPSRRRVLLYSIAGALVGVVFGIYPTLRAASMDPVEALRHE